MAQSKTKNAGRNSSKTLLVLLLVAVIALAGWIFYDNNRTNQQKPDTFQTPTGAPSLPTEFNLPPAQ